MLYHARESHYRGDVAAPSERGLEGFYSDHPAFSGEPVLTIAYAVSEQSITFLGPAFWIWLAHLFPAGEFGR